MTLINVIAIVCPLLACSTGCYRLKSLSAEQKIVLLQVFIAFITEVTGLLLTLNHHRNMFLYNIYVMIDISLIFWAATKMAGPKMKKFLILAMITYIAVWQFTIRANGLNIFSNWSFLLGCLLILATYKYLIIRKWLQTDDSFFNDKHIWMQLGIAMYFGVNIPYFCLFNYLNEYHKDIAVILFSINIILLTIRYVLTSVSFYISKQQEDAKAGVLI